MSRVQFKQAGWVLGLALLSACGGESGTASQTASAPIAQAAPTLLSTVRSAGQSAPAPAEDSATTLAPATAASWEMATMPTLAANMSLPIASRFLAQATMGPSMYSIQHLAIIGIPRWLDEQFAVPQVLHAPYVQRAIIEAGVGGRGTEDQFFESFWTQVNTGTDQLRQRVAFGLSQIFVVSFQDANLGPAGRMMASYYDVLGKHAFGNFRNLLQDVATHPAMAIYLSFMRSKKETATRVPDENFARELMQLMSIGLYELNQDGSLKLRNGKPIETYNHEDVAGLAKVFTGWSWGGPDRSDERFYGAVAHADRDVLPLQNYPNFHSTSDKQVLGSALPSGTGEQELKAALDRLFNHPNVGPFIGKQLIQRLVTSNPSPAYVSRVAAAFNNNGAGVRGDMKAVIKAILLDTEARSQARSRSAGRVREPVLRQANWMRAFYATSLSGKYKMWSMDDPVGGFAQTVLRSPSVFNFYRPSYVPPGSALAAADLVAPELQIASEPAVVGYLNVMKTAVVNGMGKNYEIRTTYQKEMDIVADADKLVDRMNLLFMAGQMSPTLRGQIKGAVQSINMLPASAQSAAIQYQKTNRIYTAVFMSMASAEYLVEQ